MLFASVLYIKTDLSHRSQNQHVGASIVMWRVATLFIVLSACQALYEDQVGSLEWCAPHAAVRRSAASVAGIDLTRVRRLALLTGTGSRLVS